MRMLRSVVELRAALAPARRAGRSIGLVPTMGALHEGHVSLIRRAREECDEVVVSLFVNPAQFNDSSDLEAYPRDEQHDLARAAEAGADLLFAPAVSEVYPAGFATTVSVTGLTERLEGAVRGAEHFHGVTTVVTKLLNMVAPEVAFFGQKDAQQAVVVRRLVADLNLPVRIVVCPTVREPDGLALSSRNVRLTPAERERAVALSRGLGAAQSLLEQGEREAREIVRSARGAMAALAVVPEYLEVVDPDTLEPLDTVERPALLLVAARIGEVRLIDNAVLTPAAAPAVAIPRPLTLATH